MQDATIRSDNGDQVSKGPIIVARHGRPVLDRTAKPRLDWRQYKDWWARYEESVLADGQVAPEKLKELVKDSDVFLSSTRPRAMETAAKAAPHAKIAHSPLYIEANLPPPLLPWVKFLPKTWNILARTAWLQGHKLDGEGVVEARVRARDAAIELDRVSAEGQVFLAAHGWFNRMLRPELKKLGWVCVYDGGDSYWSWRIYEHRKK